MKKLLLPKWQAAGLLTLLLMMICPVRANAGLQGNVTEEQIGPIQRVELDGATTITVDRDWYLRSITGLEHDLKIILKDGATLTVDQDYSETAAIDVKSLDVSGNGTLYVTGKNIGVWLRGGDLKVTNCNASFIARHGKDWNTLYGNAVEGDINNFIIDNAKVDVSGALVAIESVKTLKITGSNAALNAWGGHHCIAYQAATQANPGVTNFIMDGGEVNLTANNGTAFEISGTATITGGKLTINQNSGYWSEKDHAFSAGTLNASNCEININSALPAYYRENGTATFNNAKVNINVGLGSSGFRVKDLNITGHSDFSINASHEAIYCTGNMSLEADKFFAKSRTNEKRTVWVEGKLTIHMGEGIYEAYSDDYFPFFAVEGIEFDRPYTVNDIHDVSNLSIRQIWTNGFNLGYVLAYKDTSILSGAKITRPDLQYYKEGATTDYSVYGCFDKGTYTVGEVIHFNVPSIVTNYINKPVSNPNATPIISWWKMTKDDNGKPNNEILNNNGSTYTVRAQDVGSSIYVKFYFDTHTRDLMSEFATIQKKQRNDSPVKPVLSYRQNYVWVTNNNSSQEYLLLTTFKNVEDLTEADWAGAQSSTSSSFRMNAATGKVNYVYTRFKETATTLPGSVVLYDVVFYGTTDQMKDVVLELTDVTANAPATVIANGWIAVPLNHVIKIEAKPVPGDIIGFQGLKGSEWYLDNKITYYRDAACTQAIQDGEWGHILDADTYYKTLYVKLTRPTLTLGGTSEDRAHYVDITYNNVTKNTYLVTSNADGTYNLLAVEASNGRSPDGGDYEALYVPTGTTFEIPMTYYPVNAPTDGITFEVAYYYLNNVANTGTPPTLSCYKDNDGQLILSVDAKNSEEGLLAVVSAKQDGRVLGTLRIYVTAPDPTGIAINPGEITLEPLFGEAQLQASFIPSNAKPQAITWSSSDEDVVTVDQNGKVTVGENAIGDKATITATAGNLTATCKVTVNGTKYPLWVRGTQVNSLIQEDVFMDGKVSYIGNTLTLNGATLASNSSEPAIKSEMTNLTINVVGTNKLASQKDAVILTKSAHITGNGELTVTTTSTTGFTIALMGNEDIAINDTVKVSARNNSTQGIGVAALRDLSVNSPEAELKGFGKFASVGYGKHLIGNITEPENAKPVFHSGTGYYFVGDAAGNIVKNATVVINGTEEQQSQLVGDVNGDGRVNVSDVTTLVNMILGVIPKDETRADINGDGKINVSDVTALVNIILGIN